MDCRLLVLRYYARGLAIILVTAALVTFSGGAGFCAPSDYLGHVDQALGFLEQGITGKGVEALKRAFACNANDPLAHVAMGLALLSANRPDDALIEFNTAKDIDKNSAQAHYGKGLVYLAKAGPGLQIPDQHRKLDNAISAFATAAQADADADARGAIEYCKGIRSGRYALMDGGDLQSAMNAVALMSKRKHAEAEAIWKSLLDRQGTPDFRERAGCAISFLRSAPTVLTGAALDKSWRTPAEKNSKLPVVGGTVHLKADLSRARSVNLVLFFVDDKLVGITNKPPFQYAWLTTEVANGPHTVKIQGTDRSGISITEKTAQVIVKNEGRAIPSARVKGEEADKLWKRLWKTLQLKPSLAAINYNLAMCALEARDIQGAITALERVMAANPLYLDAADRLAGLYGSRGAQPKVYGFNTNRKVIALTFDDGPKPNTAELLSVLSRKNVKATFFVVGKQVRAYPDVFRKIVVDGHEIANHSYNHRDMEYLTDREIGREIFSTVALVRSLTGRGMRFLRPPGAHVGSKLPATVKKFGMTCVYWTANCSKVEGTTREKIINYVVNSAKPGGVVLMHNLEGVTLIALPGIIDSLRAKGYEFVTLSELAKS